MVVVEAVLLQCGGSPSDAARAAWCLFAVGPVVSAMAHTCARIAASMIVAVLVDRPLARVRRRLAAVAGVAVGANRPRWRSRPNGPPELECSRATTVRVHDEVNCLDICLVIRPVMPGGVRVIGAPDHFITRTGTAPASFMFAIIAVMCLADINHVASLNLDAEHLLVAMASAARGVCI